MFVGGFFLLLLISNGRGAIYRFEEARAQRERDRLATVLRDCLRTSDLMSSYLAPVFYLFLRPFTSTGDVKIVLRSGMIKRASTNITNYNYSGFGYTTLYRRDVRWGDFETVLAQELARFGPLVALGRPGEQVGTGRILSTEDSWQDDFTVLAAASKNVFVLPSTHPGTGYEIDQLLNSERLPQKTIFFAPPDPAQFSAPDSLGPSFALGVQAHVVSGDDLRNDALAALRASGVNARSIDELRENKYAVFFAFGSNKTIAAIRRLQVYERPLISFSLMYFYVMKLSYYELGLTLRSLEATQTNGNGFARGGLTSHRS